MAPPRRLAAWIAAGLAAAGALSVAASTRIREPYWVDPATCLQWRLARWSLLGMGAALLLSAAAAWRARLRLSAWLEGGGGRRLSRRLAGLALGAGAALSAGEALLRALAPPEAPVGYVRADAVRHHRAPPGLEEWSVTPEHRVLIRTNSLGLRGAAEPRPPGEAARILCLGDSFVAGYEVAEEDTFCVRLQGLLAPDGPVEVLNAGQFSYSPLLEWAALKELGPLLEPRLVILFLDCSDLQDDAAYAPSARFTPDGDLLGVDGTGGASRAPSASSWWKGSAFMSGMALLGHSRLYRGFCALAHAGCQGLIRRLGLRLEQAAWGDLAVDRLAAARNGTRRRLGPALARTESALLGIRDLSGRLGARLLLVTYPYGHQVDGQEWGEGRLHWGFLPGETADTWLAGAVAEFGARQGIPVVDLTGDLRGSPLRPRYFPVDGHWTEHGHAVVAVALAREIRRMGLLRQVVP